MAEARKRAGSSHEELDLWYALGRLYSRAESSRRRASRLGFTATLLSGAAVLLTAPLLGASWFGTFAPALPVFIGVGCGFGMFAFERISLRKREASIRKALGRLGLDAARPARDGLSAYYDAQLLLLRSEYEYLLEKGAKRSASLFDGSFGFTPEDGFESGPMNVAPDTQAMSELRGKWGRRLAMRRGRGFEPPGMGLREDLSYRVFPREMTVQTERAARGAYLTISRSLIRSRYGRNPEKANVSEKTKARIRRDLDSYEKLSG